MKTLSRLILASALLPLFPTGAVDISFPDFSDVSSLQLNGSATTAFDGSQQVLRLTPSVNGQAGSAFSQTTVPLNADASFSTVFSFRFTQPNSGGADGMVFVVQTVANNVGGAGGGIGYLGIPNSVGVEFDTFDNGGGFDFDANHVGIDTNGNFDPVVANLDALGQLDQGGVFYAWVDYNGATDGMEVRVNNAPSRPVSPTLTRTLNVPAILGSPNAYVGFTSATGGANNTHDVLSWGFRSDFDPFPDDKPDDRKIPEPAALVPVIVFGLGLGGWRLWRRRKQA